MRKGSEKAEVSEILSLGPGFLLAYKILLFKFEKWSTLGG